MTRRVGALLGRWLPGTALGLWALGLYRLVTQRAVPAFGPIDGHVATFYSDLLGHAGVGLFLLAIWVASWRWSGRRRPFRRFKAQKRTRSNPVQRRVSGHGD